MLLVALDTNDAVQAAGPPGSGLVAAPGGALLETAHSLADFAAADAAARAIQPYGEVWYDRANSAFAARARAARPGEALTANRQQARAAIDTLTTQWGGLTAAQQLAAIPALLAKLKSVIVDG